jgi:hypothetical protein
MSDKVLNQEFPGLGGGFEEPAPLKKAVSEPTKPQQGYRPKETNQNPIFNSLPQTSPWGGNDAGLYPDLAFGGKIFSKLIDREEYS